MHQHEMISASAGSGKTYTLTTRLMQLIADGARPERIVALTFSRAAAGEIFDSLIARLADAASDPAKAVQEARANLEQTELNEADFRSMLRSVLSSMHVSPIGTLDSFFVRVLRSFPFEFGMPGSFSILDEHALELEKDAILRQLLNARENESGGEERRSFFEVFKLATYGQEEKSVRRALTAFADSAHEVLLNFPARQLWGNRDVIWPEGSVWLDKAPGDVRQSQQAVEEALAARDLTADQMEKWQQFLDLASRSSSSSYIPLPGNASAVFWKLLGVHESLGSGNAVITIGRGKKGRFEISAQLGEHLRQMLKHIVRCELQRRLTMSAALFDILRRYESRYAARVRRTGRLTFADIGLLLDPATSGEGTVLSRHPDAHADDRLYIDYRLDGAYDHWALDEFQDTSRRQWRVIRNLVEEVLQDPGGERTFFAVGDVKQAIYGWRGGDATLMTELIAAYCHGRGPVHLRPMSKSWRSSQVVLDAVNAVFSKLDRVEGLPASAVGQWQNPDIWSNHIAARQLPGYASLKECPKPAEGGSRSAVKLRACFDEAAALLKNVEPWRHNLSAAVLVRTNSKGREVAELLRSAGVPAVWEGDMDIADNPVTAALLDLLVSAEHPGDTLAWQHVLMSPLGRCIQDAGLDTKKAAAQQVLRSVHETGFEATLLRWVHALDKIAPLSAFSRLRAEQLLGAAQQFDATGNASCLDFRSYAEAHTIRDTASTDRVRVITMHRSKGLGFDMVLLPELHQQTGITSLPPDRSVACSDGSVQPRWVLDLPKRDLCRADPILAAFLEQREAVHCFEELCLLYVAMTRAKQGLYMFVPEPSASSTAVYPATILSTLLGAEDSRDGLLYEHGDPLWYQSPSTDESAENAAQGAAAWREVSAPAREPRRRNWARRIPSRPEVATCNAASLFSPKMLRGKAFGTAVHALFQELSWIDAEPLEDVIARWRSRTDADEEMVQNVEHAFRRACTSAEIRDTLTAPADQHVVLWREKPFELMLDGEWVSGTFDRVELYRAPDGALHHARLIDFKSDRTRDAGELLDAVDRYRPQLELYRRVLARLTPLPAAAIQPALLFTCPARIVRC